ncbi:hypothetical protein VB776_05745 [Arcicella sp. DC2W]|uniref:SMODS-associated and fused to various effectors domain-containing protein n=1 Tax=Arcicella gelida TaxID=2984195 RepID=A0ABU5S1R2_9BACT|nr:hypothetical protein [Arcicella sp. DC2W]MEA5402406.1 hypothetical protein [Arcicella sp. DC2W]
MEIKSGKQIKIEELKDKNFDLFFLSENHEKRSYSLHEKIVKLNININKTFVFCYKDYVADNNKDDIYKVKIDSHTQILELIDSEIKKIEKKEVRIIVDYSCMTKPWYYSIILYLKNKKSNLNSIDIYFSYTPSKFIEPQNPKPNKDIGPLPGKYVVPTDKPKALIVCLGYEQNKAEGIIEHLDPKISYLFYTKPAIEKEFVNTLEKNNRSILKERKKYVRTYPFNDLLVLERELTYLYHLLRNDYSIIIAPLGPKPFTFIAMLMSIKYDDIDIWRVGSGNDINEYDNEPSPKGNFIICEVLFEDSDNSLT